jgi:plastocyanin
MTRTFRHLAATAAVVVTLATAAACGSSDDSDTADTADTEAGGAGADTTAADAGTRGGIYGNTGSEAPEDTSAETSTDSAAAAAPAAGDGAVTIANFSFDPADVEVAAGTTVTWTNNDGVPHRVVANDESFDSEDMGQGDTFEHTFDTAGTVDYICAIHPQMTGTITVTG